MIVWEHRIWSDRGVDGSSSGIVFYGDRGSLFLRDQYWVVVDDDGKEEEHRGGSGWTQHTRNFLDCVKSRARPNGDIVEGYRSSLLCLLGNIAHRQRGTLEWDSAKGTLSDAESAKLLTRDYRRGFELPTV